MSSARPISNNAEYRDFIKIKTKDDKKSEETKGTSPEQITEYLKKEIEDEKSTVSQFFIQLSDRNKAKLIAALVTCDETTLNQMFLPIFTKINFIPSIGAWGKIITDGINESTQWTNDFVKSIIERVLTINGDEKLIPHQIRQILHLAMSSIPDDFITIPSKMAIAREVADENNFFTDCRYFEMPKLLKESKASGMITPQQYKSALSITALDDSEFIFLTLGLLQNYIKDKTTLTTIHQNYLNINYEESIRAIIELCNQYKTEMGTDLYQQMIEKSKSLKKVDPSHNQSRRLFESRIAQLYLGSEDYLESVNYFYKYFLNKEVKTREEAVDAVYSLSMLDHKEALARHKEVVESSFKYSAIRGRKLKNNVLETHKLLDGKSGELIRSQHTSLMTSTTPTYRDEITEGNQTNRTPDKYMMDDSHFNYAKTKYRSVFSGGYSGHMIFVLALIESYLSEYKGSKEDLNHKINQYIYATTSVYMLRGYHSYLEMMDALEEPFIQELFKKYDITLTKLSENTLKNAFQDAQEYTKTLCLKKVMHETFEKHPRLTQQFLEKKYPFLKTQTQPSMNKINSITVLLKSKLIDWILKQRQEVKEHKERVAIDKRISLVIETIDAIQDPQFIHQSDLSDHQVDELISKKLSLLLGSLSEVDKSNASYYQQCFQQNLQWIKESDNLFNRELIAALFSSRLDSTIKILSHYVSNTESSKNLLNGLVAIAKEFNQLFSDYEKNKEKLAKEFELGIEKLIMKMDSLIIHELIKHDGAHHHKPGSKLYEPKYDTGYCNLIRSGHSKSKSAKSIASTKDANLKSTLDLNKLDIDALMKKINFTTKVNTVVFLLITQLRKWHQKRENESKDNMENNEEQTITQKCISLIEGKIHDIKDIFKKETLPNSELTELLNRQVTELINTLIPLDKKNENYYVNFSQQYLQWLDARHEIAASQFSVQLDSMIKKLPEYTAHIDSGKKLLENCIHLANQYNQLLSRYEEDKMQSLTEFKSGIEQLTHDFNSLLSSELKLINSESHSSTGLKLFDRKESPYGILMKSGMVSTEAKSDVNLADTLPHLEKINIQPVPLERVVTEALVESKRASNRWSSLNNG